MDFKKLSLALAISGILAGCGSDSDSNTPTPTPNPEPVVCDAGFQPNDDATECVAVPETFTNSENWKDLHPKHYESWASTIGNTEDTGPVDLLAANPNLVATWAGYGFAKSYAKARGHAFAMTDVIKSLRTGAPMKDMDGNITGEAMKASCWSCKTPDVPRMFDKVGEETFANNGWSVWGEEMHYTIGCADCHDASNPEDAPLVLSRAYSHRAVDVIDRSFDEQDHGEQVNQACAQCHVEYYFDKPNGLVVRYPWDHWVPGVETDYSSVDGVADDSALYTGFAAEAQLAYYDSIGFKDWTNAISGAPMLKAQHPEYENLADRNADTLVSPALHLDLNCADCHMPEVDGIASHNVSFQLADDCTMCHSAEVIDTKMHDRKVELEGMRFGNDGIDPRLTEVHFKAQAIWAANGIVGLEAEGTTIGEAKGNYETALGDSAADPVLRDEMTSLLTKVRYAQWFWDSATASHGIHAHNFTEAKRLLTKADAYLADALAEADTLLAKYDSDYVYDATKYDTKAKIQPLAGLDLGGMQQAKDTFISDRVEEDWPIKLQKAPLE